MNGRAVFLVVLGLGFVGATATGQAAAEASAAPNVTVFVNSGLNSPRGLRFGPDGNLYVAEGGTGGTNSTNSVCPDIQLTDFPGPYLGSESGGRISVIKNGVRTTVIDTLPSSQTVNGLVSGV